MAHRRGSGPPPKAPVNTALPVITGTTTVGQVLSCSQGTWSAFPNPTSYAYQWIRGASTEIPGATSSTYTLVLADQTNTIKCRVTVTNHFGTGTATSAATAAVT